MPDTFHIRDPGSLERLLSKLRKVNRIAIDTEFLRERTYYPQLCLIQLATSEFVAVVDPLASINLKPLYELLTGEAEILLHAGAQDLEILRDRTGTLPSHVFDTQVAAALIGLGETVGYSRMIETLLKIKLRRSEAYTDWSARPLQMDQVAYAIDDVRYLFDCHAQLLSDLEGLGRLNWAREEFRALLDRVRDIQRPELAWQRVSGARSLSGLRLATLEELASWREHAAMERNIPRQRVVPDRVLVELARRRPRNEIQLRRLRGLHSNEVARSGHALLDIVRVAAERDPGSWPAWPEPPLHTRDPNINVVATLLDAFLRATAMEKRLAPRLLGNRQQLERLVQLHLKGTPSVEELKRIGLMRGWRREAIGEDLLRVLEGRVALRIDGHPVNYRLAVETETEDG